MTQHPKTKNDGKIVLMWILGFFLTFMSVDAFFVYMALKTQPDVVERIHGQ